MHHHGRLCLASLVLVFIYAQAPRATGAASSQLCLQNSTEYLVQWLSSQPSNISDNDTIAMVRQTLVEFSANCLNATVGPQSIRLLVPVLASLGQWAARAAAWEAITGIKVVLEPVTFYLVGGEMLQELASSPLRDGWIFDPAVTGAVAGLGGFADLGPFLKDDVTLQWSDYNRFYREVSAVYGRTTIGIPLDGDLLLMYYRADLFARYNLTVPQTWDEFLGLARTMNGTDTDGDGQPDLLGACFDTLPVCKGSFLVPAVAAAYLQFQGTRQGFWFDPDTVQRLQPLVNNPGMEAALRFWHDLWPYTNWRHQTCSGYNADFQAGRCLLTFNWGDEFKAIQKFNISGPGMVGVAPLPGSTTVFDRTTQQMVACTRELCPYATPYTNTRTGAQGYLNLAPFPAFGGWTAGVSARTSPARQRAMFDFFAYLSSPANSWLDVLDPNTGTDPFRDQHLNDIDRWVQGGYPREVVTNYLQAVKFSLEHPNVMLDTRLAYDPASSGYRLPYEFALINATSVSTPDYSATMQVLEKVYHDVSAGAIQKLTSNNPLDLAQQYWSLLGRSGSVLDVLRRAKDGSTGDGNGGINSHALAAAVAVPVCVMLAAVALAALAFVHHQRKQQHRSLLGEVLAPGVGPHTTLVITDVQDSTTLFELLPVACMDAAMQQACSITREALARHTGYESATEGDSFIIAFHSANDAVMFCIDLQAALLAASWPEELLHAPPGCESVHPVWVTAGPQAQPCLKMLQPRAPSVQAESSKESRVCFAQDQPQARSSPSRWWSVFQAAPPPIRSTPSLSGRPGSTSQHPLTEYLHMLEGGDLLAMRDSSPGSGPLILHTPSQDDMKTDASAAELSLGMLELGLASDTGPVSGAGMGIGVEDWGSKSIAALQQGGSKAAYSASTAGSLRALVEAAWQLARPRASSRSGGLSMDLAGVMGRCTGDGSARVLAFQGLRVRCGVHTGAADPQDISYNAASGRTMYGGSFLAAAKLIEGATHGAQVCLSQATFSALDKRALPADVLLLHLGEHQLEGPKPGSPAALLELQAQIMQGVGGVEFLDAGAGDAGTTEAAGEAVEEAGEGANCTQLPAAGQQLYTASNLRLAPRLALLAEPKTAQTLARGVLAAPLQQVTIGFMHMVGSATLMAWSVEETRAALSTYSQLVKQSLLRHDGYLVEHVDGFVLLAFRCPLSALACALEVEAHMLRAPWSPALLRHALAEELAITQHTPGGGMRRVVLLRGPRIKAGLDTGVVRTAVHATTGRMAYRGKVMNRAARLSGHANSSQVLCSWPTWSAAAAAAGAAPEALSAGRLTCVRTGQVQLKGIKGALEVCQVHLAKEHRSSLLVSPEM